MIKKLEDNLENFEDKELFPNELSKFVYYRTYSRWNYDKKRRETWPETVDRVMAYYKKIGDKNLSTEDYDLVKNSILHFKAMPSMRLVWSAGTALDKNHLAAYNCSYLAIDNIHSWSEIMYILMHGTGVGYSVEQKNIQKIPPIKPTSGETVKVVFEDSKEGWAIGLQKSCEAWWNGHDVNYDLHKIRPKGAILKTFGGRASGPGPLKECLDFFSEMLIRHRGRVLSPINCHDLACMVANAIVVGGVRRSAMISLSDLHNEGMRHAKDGQFWIKADMRRMSNNSAVYEHKPSSTVFMEEWLSLAKSGSGERGIFNRSKLKDMIPKRRRHQDDMGVNPCSEIILRNRGLCNLSEVVIRSEDTYSTIMDKIKAATIMGTLQSMLTDFGTFLPDKWKKNADSERLLGVSLTGQMDNPAILTDDNLQEWKDYAIGVNVEYSKKLGITRSKAITCTKPSGTVSTLVDSSSGFHPRFAKFYIRRVRISATDPLYKFLRSQNMKFYPEVGQIDGEASMYVCEFPIKAPDNCVTVSDVSAIEQLIQWKKIKENWAEHTVSATIYVEDDEWFKVGNWVYENFDSISGVSFLPKSKHVYQLAPYEEIDEKRYNQMIKEMPKNIDYSLLAKFESEDMTEGSKNFACTSGACEII